MSDWMSDPKSEMKKMRQVRIDLMKQGFGSALDVLDAFNYQAHYWKSAFCQGRREIRPCGVDAQRFCPPKCQGKMSSM